MSTAVAERLDSLVTKDPIPCELRILGEYCGQPSKYKLHRECECGLKSTRHLCEECYFNLILGQIFCHICLRPVVNWTLA